MRRMSTSLSRQLSQLRASAPAASALASAAPHSASATSDALFSSGPFLIDRQDDDDLDLNGLRQLARASFARVAEAQPDIQKMRVQLELDELGGEEGEKDDDKNEDEDDGSSWQADLLLLLSPLALKAPAQIVLQWMVTKHKVTNNLRPKFRQWFLNTQDLFIGGAGPRDAWGGAALLPDTLLRLQDLSASGRGRGRRQRRPRRSCG